MNVSPTTCRPVQSALICLAGLWAAGPLAAHAACVPGLTEPVTIADVNDRMELVTDKGTLLRLNGIENMALDPDADDALYDATETLRDWVVGKTMLMQRVTQEPDRWKRLDVQLFMPSEDGGAARSLAVRLVEAGEVRVAPEAGAMACLTDLLAAEAKARAAKQGIWADVNFAMLAPDSRDALNAKQGKFVVIEGNVVGTGESRTRFYLNFGTSRWRDLTVTILKRDEKVFENAELSPKSLIGARLRVRGVLDRFYGPEIEISDPNAIEIVTRP